MKALVKFGNQYGNLRIEDWAMPVTDDDGVVIEVKAAGICGSDMHSYRGTGVDDPTFHPTVLGHEFAGVISSVGKNVTNWKIGDRVVSENTAYACGVCSSCIVGDYVQCAQRSIIGYAFDGGFTNFVKIPGHIMRIYPNGLFRIPDHVSFEEASVLDPYCNGYKAVIQEAHFAPGENLVVFGTGPLGLSCVHIAHLAGANKIIAVGMSSDKSVRFPIAQKLGATDVIAANEEDVAGRIQELCGKDGVRLAVESSGTEAALRQALVIVRNAGMVVQIGLAKKDFTLPIDMITRKALNLKGHMGYNTISWRSCLTLLEQGKLDVKSMITHRLPLSDWENGFMMMMRQEACKVILLPEPLD